MMTMIKPMEPVLVLEPFDDLRYLYQVKWDGIRILAYLSPQGIELRTKRGNLRTEQYPELLVLQKYFSGENAIIDGEVIVIGEGGIPNFHKVLQRDLRKNVTQEIMTRNPVIYLVFDLVYLGNRFVTGLTLLERQKLLEKYLRPAANIYLCDNYVRGKELYQIMEGKGMEGIVAKEKNGLYYCGEKNKTWQKIKCFRELNVILGGVALKDGRITALLVGGQNDQPEGNNLSYLGKVFSGLNSRDLAQIRDIMQVYEEADSPFANPPQLEKGVKVIWLPPYLIIKIQYLEWSEKGILRNPVFRGFVGNIL